MNVNIGRGYGKILFGMKPEQIVIVLGKPDKIIHIREDGFEYIYNALKIKLFFDIEEYERLYSIEVFDEDVIFISEKIIGMSLNAFLDFMKKNGFSDYEFEDYDYFSTYYFDQCNTSFTVNFDEISSFEFSPLFKKDNNTIIWPIN